MAFVNGHWPVPRTDMFGGGYSSQHCSIDMMLAATKDIVASPPPSLLGNTLSLIGGMHSADRMAAAEGCRLDESGRTGEYGPIGQMSSMSEYLDRMLVERRPAMDRRRQSTGTHHHRARSTRSLGCPFTESELATAKSNLDEGSSVVKPAHAASAEQLQQAAPSTDSCSPMDLSDKRRGSAAAGGEFDSPDVAQVGGSSTLQGLPPASLCDEEASSVGDQDGGAITHASALGLKRRKRRSLPYNTPSDSEISPRWLAPFEHGWRRLLVLRNPMPDPNDPLKTSVKTVADAYYYTPCNKKLRSMPQIEEYISSHPNPVIALDCFTFIRKAITREPYETVRTACKSGRGRPSAVARKHSSKDSADDANVTGTSFLDLLGVSQAYSSSPAPCKQQLAYSQSSPGEQQQTPSAIGRVPAALHEGALYLGVKRKVSSSASDNAGEVGGESATDLAAPRLVTYTGDELWPIQVPSRPLGKKIRAGKDAVERARAFLAALPTDAAPASPFVRHPMSFALHSSGPRPWALPSPLLPNLCSLRCPGMAGQPPTLYCGVCICLFHPECVNFIGSPRNSVFVCLRCLNDTGRASPLPRASSGRGRGRRGTGKPRGVPRPQVQYHWSPNMEVDRRGDYVAMRANGVERREVWRPAGSVVPLREAVGAGPSVPHYAMRPPPLLLEGGFPFSGTSSPTVLNGDAFGGSVNKASRQTAEHMHVDDVSRTEKLIGGDTVKVNGIDVSGSMCSVSPSDGPAASMDNQRGRLITLPSSVAANRIDPNQPLVLKLNNESYTVERNNMHMTPHSVRIFLPTSSPTTDVVRSELASLLSSPPPPPPCHWAPPYGSGAGMLLTSMASSVATIKSGHPAAKSSPRAEIGLFADGCTFARASEVVTGHGNSLPLKDCLHNTGGKGRTSPAAHGSKKRGCGQTAPIGFQQLMDGYDSLLRIFGYLPTASLLTAALVSHSWRRITRNAYLWHRLSLKGCLVKDWRAAVTFARERGVRHIDFDGMHLEEGPASAMAAHWRRLSNELHRLVTLQELSFSSLPCPLHLLQTACFRLPHLQSVVALHVTAKDDSSNSAGRRDLVLEDILTRCSGLERLCLRGNDSPLPLTLPSSNYWLSQPSLVNLKCLAVTSLHGVPGESFLFVSALPQLEELELGDCWAWTDQNYNTLAYLRRLRHLGLECGTSTGLNFGLADLLRIPYLNRLLSLRLVNYELDTRLAKALASAEQLHSLDVVSRPCHVTASRIDASCSTAYKVLMHATQVKQLKWTIEVCHELDSNLNVCKSSSETLNDWCIPFELDDEHGQVFVNGHASNGLSRAKDDNDWQQCCGDCDAELAKPCKGASTIRLLDLKKRFVTEFEKKASRAATVTVALALV